MLMTIIFQHIAVWYYILLIKEMLIKVKGFYGYCEFNDNI
ncbi:hypothetical protein A225_3884 [Klebsiella michiganensis E718]|nr:hypothetical protein A225_3884 [Klebsiella michiganensis E718]